jgi:hypothetical protein
MEGMAFISQIWPSPAVVVLPSRMVTGCAIALKALAKIPKAATIIVDARVIILSPLARPFPALLL